MRRWEREWVNGVRFDLMCFDSSATRETRETKD